MISVSKSSSYMNENPIDEEIKINLKDIDLIEKGRILANKSGCSFIVTSARTGYNV